MPNPYFALLFLLAFIGSMLGAERFGYKRGENAATVECGRLKDAAYQDLSKRYEAASRRADSLERATRDAAERRSSLEASLTPSLEGIRNAKPIPADCLDSDMRVRLNQVIQSINSAGSTKADYTLRLPAKVPASAGTDTKRK